MANMERRNPEQVPMALPFRCSARPELTLARGRRFESIDSVVLADADADKTSARDTSETELERTTMRKEMQRILPMVLLGMVVSYIDRVNIGFAALTMNADLGLSATAFGLGAGLFFLTYFLFEVPSNLALER